MVAGRGGTGLSALANKLVIIIYATHRKED
jgi:hypothetical protein